jgi:putative ABC transport system permease protein
MNAAELINCVEIGLIYGIAAIGIFLTFRVINFPDMTCDGSFVLGAAISGVLIRSGANPWLAVVASCAGGAFAGLATGVINSCFRVSDLLSGILVSFMLYSVNIRVMGGIPNISLGNATTIFSNANTLLILSLLCSLVVAKLIWLFSTDFGLGMRSVGQSAVVAANYGVNTKIATVLILMISNALIGLSGAIFNQQQGFVDVSQGIGTLIVGLAAVIMGEKLFRSRSYFIAIPACVIGSIVYRIFVCFALHSDLFGLKTHDLNLVTGVLMIAAMAMPKFWRKSCCSCKT